MPRSSRRDSTQLHRVPAIKRVQGFSGLEPRAADAHKGTFGRVLVIAGSVGMAGAPSLVANAALRSGAGLVTIAVPEPILATVAGLAPCATTIPLPANKSGQIKPAAALKLFRQRGLIGATPDPTSPDAVAFGPGVGIGSADNAARFFELIDAFRIETGVPAVIDADGIKLAALLQSRRWDQRAHPRTVFTPHPGELAQLLGTTPGDVQAARESVAVDTARRLNANVEGDQPAVLALKGAGTIVTDGKRAYTNRTGNPGLATGGTGDVLTGIIAALLAQGLSPFDAAAFGAHIHGLAGDLAAESKGQISMIATDLFEHLPAAFQSAVPRPRRTRRRTPQRAPSSRSRKPAS